MRRPQSQVLKSVNVYDAGDDSCSASCWRSSRLTRPLSRRPWNKFFRNLNQVRFDANSMWVDLSDGRTLGVPLAWFPASSAPRRPARC